MTTTTGTACFVAQITLPCSEVERIYGLADSEGEMVDDLLSRSLQHGGIEGAELLCDPAAVCPWLLARTLLIAQAGETTRLRLLEDEDFLDAAVDLVMAAADEGLRRLWQ